MIDLPQGPRPTGHTGATSPAAEIRPAELARMQISQTIEAVVLETKLQQQSGAAQKPVYDILLKASATPASNPPLNTTSSASAPTTASNLTAPLTQITADSITLMRQGQSILIKTAAEFPLQPGAQLLASVSPTKGVVLHQILPPQLAASINQALKQLVPQQQSLSPLFGMVEEVNGQKVTGLPKTLQAQLSTLLQLLPKLEQLKTAEQLRTALNNSGLFLENKIQKALVQAVQSQNSYAQTATTKTETNNNIGKAALTQGLKELSQLVKNAVSNRQPSTAESSPRGASFDLGAVVKGDIKQQLISLQARLEQTQADMKTRTGSETQAGVQTGRPIATVTGNASAPTQSAPGAGATAINPNAESAKAAEGKASPNSLNPTGSAQRTEDAYPPTRQRATGSHDAAFVPSRPAPNKVQGYNAIQSSTASVGDAQSKSNIETFLLPPLPGNIMLQPQPRSRHVASGDMADALVSILLKQVKGALSRITLHQLASQNRGQDTNAPQPLLSFELPILHQGQVQIFQFLIEEEEASSDKDEKQQGKRWVVQMAFDIEGLGPMLCQISLIGHSAAVSFWAEWENTLQHTKDNFDYLQQVLTDMGLKVEKLQGHLGIPKSEQAILQNQLVDIRT